MYAFQIVLSKSMTAILRILVVARFSKFIFFLLVVCVFLAVGSQGNYDFGAK